MRIDVRLAEKHDWVKLFEPRDCTVFVASADTPAFGQPVRLDLTIEGGGPRVIFRGSVISHSGEGPGPSGFVVALGPEEREKINYLNGFVRGGLLNLRERRRLPLRLPIRYGSTAAAHQTYTRDINEEGVFVVSEQPLPEDSPVHLVLEIPGHSEPITLTGVVSHTVVVEDEDLPGMGIVFDDSTILANVVDELEKRFLAGSLPDDVLL